jgi:hypothetical protein
VRGLYGKTGPGVAGRVRRHVELFEEQGASDVRVLALTRRRHPLRSTSIEENVGTTAVELLHLV